MKRTFSLERVYHQLMKSRQVPREKLADVVSLLVERGFIELVLPEHEDGELRYSENEKLTSGENKKELFKLLEKVKHGASNFKQRE